MLDIIIDKIKEISKSRLFPITIVYCLLISMLVTNLFKLQIVEGETYQEKYEQQTTATREIKSTRGNIYDVNGNLLAYNTLIYSVVYEDTGEITDTTEKNAMIHKLIKLIEKNGDQIDVDFGLTLNEKDNTITFTDKSESAILRFKKEVYSVTSLTEEQIAATAEDVFLYLRDDTSTSSPQFQISSEEYNLKEQIEIMSIRFAIFLNRYQKYVPVSIATDVSETTVAAVKESSADLPGFDIAQNTQRVYTTENNENVTLSHVLGYTGSLTADSLAEIESSGTKDMYTEDDTTGKSGIEKEFEEYLHGTKGYNNITLNSSKRIVDEVEGESPTAGDDVYLTIDADLQSAAYTILEKRLAGILVSKIINSKTIPSVDNTKNLKIPVYDVYFALLDNNVIDITRFNAENATDLEQSVYRTFKVEQDSVFADLKAQLKYGNTNTSVSEDMQDYLNYIYSMLKSDKVLIADAIDTEDSQFVAYADRKLSLSQFLQYAIGKDWVSREKFSDTDEYYSSQEIYTKLVDYIITQLTDDSDFNKKLYENLVYSDKITGKQICLLLFDQGMLEYDKEAYNKLLNNQIQAYNFIVAKIKNLEITPAQLALHPCSGSIVVTDVKNGNVKALVSYPSYDNNMLANKVDSQYYASLTSDLTTPLVNRPTQQKTAPGSTYKPLVGLTGLAENIITTTKQITDLVTFKKITPYASCWSKHSHGSINVTQAIEVSCNYFFYEVGYQLGKASEGSNYNSDLGLKRLRKYAEMFGFGDTSGVEIPELVGTISDDSSVRSAIGQGRNSYTPVQIAKYVTAIANRGLVYDLSLVDSVKDTDGTVVNENEPTIFNDLTNIWSNSEWNSIHSGMNLVVNGTKGSLYKLFSPIKVKVAGKTGTAQENTKSADHALFTSFAPYDDPEITVTVVIPNGYTSTNAAETARDIYRYYYMDSEEEKEAMLKEAVTTPGNVVAAED